MKKTILISLLLFSILNSFAQNSRDSIEIRNGFGTTFRQNGKLLSEKQLESIVQSNKEASKEMKIAKINYTAGNVFSFCGGLCIGWPIGTYLGGKKPDWNIAFAGVGLLIVSFPFSINYTLHAKNAANIYNNGLKLTSFNSVNIIYGLTNNGLGITLKF